MPFQIDGRGDMNAFVLTSPLAGVMLLTRRQPFYPSAAHDKFHSICTAFGGYTEFGIAPLKHTFRIIRINGFKLLDSISLLLKNIVARNALTIISPNKSKFIISYPFMYCGGKHL